MIPKFVSEPAEKSYELRNRDTSNSPGADGCRPNFKMLATRAARLRHFPRERWGHATLHVRRQEMRNTAWTISASHFANQTGASVGFRESAQGVADQECLEDCMRRKRSCPKRSCPKRRLRYFGLASDLNLEARENLLCGQARGGSSSRRQASNLHNPPLRFSARHPN